MKLHSPVIFLFCPSNFTYPHFRRSVSETQLASTSPTSSTVASVAAAVASSGSYLLAGGAVHNGAAVGTTVSDESHGVSSVLHGSSRENKPVMLVFLVGGLSFLEIAAFRYLSREPSFPYTIVMATTKLINGSKLLRSLIHEVKAN